MDSLQKASDALFEKMDMDDNETVSFVELQKCIVDIGVGNYVDFEKLNDDFGVRRNREQFFEFYKGNVDMLSNVSNLESPADDTLDADDAKAAATPRALDAPAIDESVKLIDSMATSVYVRALAIGGGGGSVFIFDGRSDGALIQKITVWSVVSKLKAIKVWLTNGKVQQFGQYAEGTSKTFTFAVGETIQELSLWGNGIGTRVGGIKFKTNRGNEFSHQMKEWPLQQEYPIDVGSGICVGVFGRHGHDLDALGFRFVKPIKSSTLIDMEYPTLGIDDTSIQTDALFKQRVENNSDVTQTQTLSATTTITESSNWSITAGIDATVTSSVTAGVPGVAEAEVGYQLTVRVEGSYGRSFSTTEETKYEFPLIIPPRTTLNVEIVTGKAILSLPYTAKLKIVTTDNSDREFGVQGTYEGISYASIRTTINQEDEDGVFKDLSPEEASRILGKAQVVSKTQNTSSTM